MTAIARRARPSWPRLVGIQFHMVLRSGRWVELVGGTVALLSFAVLVTGLLLWAPLPHSPLPIRILIDRALPLWMLLVLAFTGAWASFLWRGEPPGPRRAHWSLPIPRGTHDLARVAAGGIWILIVAVAVGAVRVLSLPTSSRAPLIIYGGFVLGLIATYCVASIPAVVAAKPARWFYGGLAAYALLLAILPGQQDAFIEPPLSAFLNATGASSVTNALMYESIARADPAVGKVTDSTEDDTYGLKFVPLTVPAPTGGSQTSRQVRDAWARQLGAPYFFNRWTTLASTLWIAGAIAVLLFISASRHER